MVGFFAAFPDEAIVATLSQQLSWSHFRELLPLKQPLQREYYAEMCRLERWSVRTLRQRIDSMLYERTALSRKPEKLIEHELDHLRNTERVTPDLLMRDPYMLDFLGLQDIYIEDDLEAAIVREMEKFLLELGAGFSFVARQKRVQLDDEIRDNLKDVQLRAGLRPSESLDSGDFTVEMETGTGKTYVYLRTIFELNRRFGFIKFVIVVPSVTIRQSVYKTLQITEEHFRKNSRPSGTASSTRRPIAFFSTSSN